MRICFSSSKSAILIKWRINWKNVSRIYKTKERRLRKNICLSFARMDNTGLSERIVLGRDPSRWGRSQRSTREKKRRNQNVSFTFETDTFARWPGSTLQIKIGKSWAQVVQRRSIVHCARGKARYIPIYRRREEKLRVSCTENDTHSHIATTSPPRAFHLVHGVP